MTVQQRLDLAWKQFDPLRPVPQDDPDGWYQDLSEVRAVGDFGRQIARRIERQADRPQRLLVLGHRGCGKSTELGRLCQRLEQSGFRCAVVRTDEHLDVNDLDLIEIQVLLVEQLGRLLGDLKLELPEALLTRLRAWFTEEEVTREVKRSASADLGAGAGGEAPSLMGLVFSKLIPQFKANLRLSAEHRATFREKVRKQLRDFVGVVSDVVREAKGRLQVADFKGLVLIVDGVEKAAQSADGRQRVSRILLEQAEQWNQLDAPLVLTGPLDLFTENIRLQNLYDAFFLMPAVPVAPRPGHEADTAAYANAGRGLLRALIDRRTPAADIFEDEASIEVLIQASGGSIRDLFRLLRNAIDSAEDRLIGAKDVQHALKLQRLSFEPAVLLSDREPLQRLAADPVAFDHSKVGVSLLQRELVIPYSNGGTWFALHPAVRRLVLGEHAG